MLVILYITRGEVSTYAKNQIRVGTTRERVLQLCGPPTETDAEKSYFSYDNPSITGWYVVRFDENGRVVGIDDESF